MGVWQGGQLAAMPARERQSVLLLSSCLPPGNGQWVAESSHGLWGFTGFIPSGLRVALVPRRWQGACSSQVVARCSKLELPRHCTCLHSLEPAPHVGRDKRGPGTGAECEQSCVPPFVQHTTLPGAARCAGSPGCSVLQGRGAQPRCSGARERNCKTSCQVCCSKVWAVAVLHWCCRAPLPSLAQGCHSSQPCSPGHVC